MASLLDSSEEALKSRSAFKSGFVEALRSEKWTAKIKRVKCSVLCASIAAAKRRRDRKREAKGFGSVCFVTCEFVEEKSVGGGGYLCN